MGSSRRRHSTVRKAGAFRARKGKTTQPKPPLPTKTDFRELLGRLSDAISIIATATSALEAAQDPTVMEDAAEVADKIHCLVRGVAEVRRIYDDLDHAIMELS
jgi:hypothetical protein